MSRRSVERDKAFEIFKEHNGDIMNRTIAEMLSTPEKVVSDKTVGGWKTKDKWVQQLNGVLQSDERSTPVENVEYSNKVKKEKLSAAMKGNQNSVGNRGGKGATKGNQYSKGYGAPRGNKNAETHGFFSRHFPEEVAELAAEIMEKPQLEMIWESIVIQYTAIIRAQRLMFVRDQEDMTKELKKEKIQSDLSTVTDAEGNESAEMVEAYGEREYEIQFAWDKHATFINAQSRAMSTLASLIKQFDELANKDDERRAKLNLMNAQIDKIRNDLNDENPAEDKIGQYLDKLEGAFKDES